MFVLSRAGRRRLVGAISDRQRELAPDLHWVGRVHNALRVEDWPFAAGKGDYALFLGRTAPWMAAPAPCDR